MYKGKQANKTEARARKDLGKEKRLYAHCSPTAHETPLATIENLEVLVERETSLDGLVVRLCADRLVDARLGICRHARFEKVGLALEGNHLHKVEWVGHVPDLVVAERDEQAVRDKFNVLAHELGVHANERDGQGVYTSVPYSISHSRDDNEGDRRTSQELLLNLDSLPNDTLNGLGVRPSPEVGEQQAGEIGVQTLVTRDELVGECQSRHQAALLEPKDGRKRAREKDTLDGGKRNQALGKGRTLVRDPLERPVGLFLDAGDGVDRLEQVGPAVRVFNVGVDEERVGFRVNVLPA